MPVSAPTDPNPTPVPPPRRSWRDLPATPPVADFLPPPDPDHLVAEAGAGGEQPPTDEPAADPGPGQPRSRKRTWLAVGLVAALVGAVGGIVWTQGSSSGSTSTTPTVAPSKDPSSQSSVEQVAKALGPAVVQIEVGQGLGSGVIYDAKGLILTAHHVVEGTDDVTVRTADKQELKGRVVGRAPEKDLAIVAVKPTSDLTAAPLAEAGSVEVGETAIALGSPFGYQQTVTAGIVSGLDREIDSPVGKLTGLIQTDAPINPGNSGGPLADASAKVIGINTAIASASGGSDGVGFAIPVEVAKDLMDQVQKAGGIDAPTVSDPGGSSSSGRATSRASGTSPASTRSPAWTRSPGSTSCCPQLQDLLPGLGSGSGSLDGALRDMLNQLFPGLGDMLGGGQGSQGQEQRPGQQQGGQATPAPDNGSGSQASPSSLSLVEVPSPPKGYTQARSTARTAEKSGGLEGTQLIVLEGDSGQITVAAERSDQTNDRFAALKGKATQINGHKAVAMDHGSPSSPMTACSSSCGAGPRCPTAMSRRSLRPWRCSDGDHRDGGDHGAIGDRRRGEPASTDVMAAVPPATDGPAADGRAGRCPSRRPAPRSSRCCSRCGGSSSARTGCSSGCSSPSSPTATACSRASPASARR